MGIPRSPEARDFYRCAYQRLRESRFLLDADYSNAAVYLSGYAIECVLKALILDSIPTGRVTVVRRSFAGSRGHDFSWLRGVYLANGGARFPPNLAGSFTLVNGWNTDLRYSPRKIRLDEATRFLDATNAILAWADGRL